MDNSSDESDNENAEFDCTKAVATSILNLREHKKVPKQICQNFIDLTNALLVSQQNSLVYQIKRKMLDENIPENTVKKVCSNILNLRMWTIFNPAYLLLEKGMPWTTILKGT